MIGGRRRLRLSRRHRIERQPLRSPASSPNLLAQPVDARVRPRASRRAGSSRSAGSAPSAPHERLTRRCRSGGSACRRSRAPADRGRRRISGRQAGSDRSSERARVRIRKSAVLSFSVTVEPASSLVPSAARRRCSVRRHRLQLERAEFGDVVRRRWSRPRCSWSRGRG